MKKLCRFCLKIIRDQNFDVINEITVEILDVLLIQMDLILDGKSLMCSECQDGLERCFNFKSVCLYSEDSIAEYIREGFKLDLAEVYFKKIKRKSKRIPRGHKICRLCMKITKTAKCLNNADELIALTNDKLQKFVPELNINVVKDPVICETCLMGLQSYSEFAASCLDVEKKINRYCEARGVAKRQVQLYSVVQFTLQDVQESDTGEYALPSNTGNLEDKSNIEVNYKELNINTIEFGIKTEEIMLKSEDDSDSDSTSNSNSEGRLNNVGQVHFPGAKQCNPNDDVNCDKNKNYVNIEEKSDTLSLPTVVKGENADHNQSIDSTKCNGDRRRTRSMVQRSVPEFAIQNEEIEIKSDVDMRDNDKNVVSEKTKKNMYCCQLCTFSTRGSKVFDRHLLIHKTPAEVIVYKCDDCSFITKFKSKLTLHTMKLHGYPQKFQVLKCKLCPYTSTNSTVIRKHERIHLPPSERPKLKCSLCAFQCFGKPYFKEHLKIHGRNSESAWLKCTTCSFKTLHSSSYKRHMRIHNPIHVSDLFHCAHCPYKSKVKYTLKVHLLRHRNKSEIITFNCDKCPYKAKRKETLIIHMRTHKILDEQELYKCEICLYATSRKAYLKYHILQHKDKSEVQMYRCDICNFETKYKCSLKDHKKFVHSSQMKMYKCDVCSFLGKTRGALKSHMLSHKSFEEIPIYKCFHCPYRAKTKFCLKEHLQVHMDESRRQKFKCEVCGFEVTAKRSLKRHNNTCVRNQQMGVNKKTEK